MINKKKYGRGKSHITENVRYRLRDKDGNVKPVFRDNRLFQWLMRKGLVSPKAPKIPFLFGTWSQSRVISNLLVDDGKAGIASRINGADSEAAFEYIALGTGTTSTASDDTELETETHREQATVSRTTTSVTDDTARLENTFSFSSSHALTESGVFNDDSSGVMAARQTFSEINVDDGDSLDVTWDLDVSGA